jgi:hypothetical protein
LLEYEENQGTPGRFGLKRAPSLGVLQLAAQYSEKQTCVLANLKTGVPLAFRFASGTPVSSGLSMLNLQVGCYCWLAQQC